MSIVIGRGNRRQVYIIPAGAVLTRFTQDEQPLLIANLTELLRIK